MYQVTPPHNLPAVLAAWGEVDTFRDQERERPWVERPAALPALSSRAT